jgi:hypothetical protein
MVIPLAYTEIEQASRCSSLVLYTAEDMVKKGYPILKVVNDERDIEINKAQAYHMLCWATLSKDALNRPNILSSDEISNNNVNLNWCKGF